MSEEKKEYEVWRVGEHHFQHGNEILELPEGWCVVERGDPALTRRIKMLPEFWVILGKYKNKITKKGVCAPEAEVDRIRRQLVDERANPAYRIKLEKGRRVREAKQREYVGEFEQEVLNFLHFHEKYQDIAAKLARAVTNHATPVGSGTVARTKRISVQERAEAAVIAWMRHHTTAYDRMHISHIPGERRNVRRQLAEVSRAILDRYRLGKKIAPASCPLAKALNALSDKEIVQDDKSLK